MYSLEEVVLPESLTEIGGFSFNECDNLKEVTLPENVGVIRWCAFYGCDNMKNVVIPDTVHTIEDEAFVNCVSLENIVLPMALTSVNTRVFQNCTALKEVQLPQGLITIYTCVFQNCTALEAVDIPDSVTTMAAGAFEGCTSLQSVSYPAGWTTVLSDRNSEGATEGSSSYYTPFSGCTALKTVTVDEGVTVLPRYAFRYMYSLEEVKLPESLTEIGSFAFNDCTSLKEVIIPENVEVIRLCTFFGCEQMKNVVIPDTVHTIEDEAFVNCTSLESIVLPELVTAVRAKTFQNCASLRHVQLPQNLTSMGEYAFSECASLETMDIPEGITSIPLYAFRNCTSLRDISLPKNLSSIEHGAFEGCKALEMIVLPDGVTWLSNDIFKNCTGLKTVMLPSVLEGIGGYVFQNCTSLESIYLPEGCTTLSDACFLDCVNLKAVHIPNTVSYIAGNAFAGAPNAVLHCSRNSYASIYAIDHGLAVEIAGEADKNAMVYLDPDNSYYTVSGTGISSSGHLVMNAKFTFKDPDAISDVKLMVHVPKSVFVTGDSVKVNQELCTGYIHEDETMQIPVTGSANGTLQFLMEPETYDPVSSYAKVTFTVNGQTVTETIGAVYQELPTLSISAPEETSVNLVHVSGVTMPHTNVEISVDGALQTTALSYGSGNYNALAILDNVSEGKRYRIQAKITDASGSNLTAETVVIYKSGRPKLVDFTMSHNGQSFAMESILGKVPLVTYNPDLPFHFTVKLENRENVQKVFVIDKRNGAENRLEAVWNPKAGRYIAEGHLGSSNTHGAEVPGTIVVAVVDKQGKVSLVDGSDFYSEEAMNALPDIWRNANVTVHENTGTKTSATIQLSEDNSRGNHTGECRIPGLYQNR